MLARHETAEKRKSSDLVSTRSIPLGVDCLQPAASMWQRTWQALLVLELADASWLLAHADFVQTCRGAHVPRWLKHGATGALWQGCLQLEPGLVVV